MSALALLALSSTSSIALASTNSFALANTSSLGFELLRPAWFAAVLLAPLVLGAGVLALSARARARAKLVSERNLARFLPRYSENRARRPSA